MPANSQLGINPNNPNICRLCGRFCPSTNPAWMRFCSTICEELCRSIPGFVKDETPGECDEGAYASCA